MATAQTRRRDVVLIGTSAGGVKALFALFERLPADFGAAIGVVIHRSPSPGSILADVLGRRSRLAVVEPENGQPFQRGRIYLAPRDHHMYLSRGAIYLDRAPKQHHVRPAIDPMFTSAAKNYGARVIGALLTGTLSDGVSGLVDIKSNGGLSIVQDPNEAEFPSMPENALIHDSVDLEFRLDAAAALLSALTKGASPDSVAGLPGVRRPGLEADRLPNWWA